MEIGIFLLYVAGGVGVFVGGLLFQRILRRAAPPPSSEPYECGEKPIGPAHAPFLWPYLRLVVLLLVLEAEVVVALPWVWVHRSLEPSLRWIEVGLLTFPLGLAYGYAIRQGWLTFRQSRSAAQPSLPAAYRELNAYLASRAPGPSSYSSRLTSEGLLPSPGEQAAPQTD